MRKGKRPGLRTMKKAHHAGTHEVVARKVCATAKANPNAVCWRDGLTLDQHAPHHDGTPAYWTGGHTVDGYPNAPAWLDVTRKPPPGPWIAPEASTENYAHGANKTNKLRTNPHSRPWLRRST